MVDSKKKSWQKPQTLMEQGLVARAQDPEGDAFLGVLNGTTELAHNSWNILPVG